MFIFVICKLLASVIMHMFCSLDCKTAFALDKIDVAVINLNTIGTSTSYFYYMLYCHSTFNILSSFIMGISPATVFIISMSNFIHESKNRFLKVIILSSPMVINFCFGLYTRFWMDFKNDKYPYEAFNYLFLAFLSYAIGAIFYASRFPEKYYPKRFDYVGASH